MAAEMSCEQIFEFVQNELNINDEHRRNVMYTYPKFRSDSGVRRQRAIDRDDTSSEASFMSDEPPVNSSPKRGGKRRNDERWVSEASKVSKEEKNSDGRKRPAAKFHQKQNQNPKRGNLC
jgi:hypothetical protein